MYGYSEYVPLNEEEIRKRVTDDEIIEMVLGEKPIPYLRIKSPIKLIRGFSDNKPGAWFEYWNGKLFFIDFGDNPTHRVSFKFAADYYNITFRETLEYINSHFQLGLGDSSVALQIPIKPSLYNTEDINQSITTKIRSLILYKARPFQLKDGNFWGAYNIKRQELITDGVEALIWFKIYSEKDKKWHITRPHDPSYIFTEFKVRSKIYRPQNKNHKMRFLSNCGSDDVGNIHNIPVSGKTLLIKKSYKDCRVIRNIGIDATIWFQNEGAIPSKIILIDLCERFDTIFVWFDNDQPGIEATFKVVNAINALYPNKAFPIWLPEYYAKRDIKDPSDLVKKRGEPELIKFMIEKGLYERHTSNNSL